MGIRFYCPNGHKLNVKAFQAGKRGICPYCGSKFLIPSQSTRRSSKEERAARKALAAASFPSMNPGAHNSALVGAGDPPAAEIQAFSQKSASSPQTIDSSKTGEGSGFTSPVLPAPSMSIAEELTAFSLENPSIALTHSRQSDPFTEAGDVVWYVRPPSGGQYGPATVKLMRQWLAEGRISPDTLVWREGWRNWQPASAVFPQLRANDPLIYVAKDDVRLVEPISSMSGQPTIHQTPKNILILVVTLIFLTILIIIGLFIWAFYHGPSSSEVNSRTPSTRLELRDTLRLDCHS
jgi:hypothetical protein